jgi:hypothetical protein
MVGDTAINAAQQTTVAAIGMTSGRRASRLTPWPLTAC